MLSKIIYGIMVYWLMVFILTLAAIFVCFVHRIQLLKEQTCSRRKYHLTLKLLTLHVNVVAANDHTKDVRLATQRVVQNFTTWPCSPCLWC